jgi:hypothetical protein
MTLPAQFWFNSNKEEWQMSLVITIKRGLFFYFIFMFTKTLTLHRFDKGQI